MFEVDNSWQDIINKALKSFDKEYLEFLKNDIAYFPNRDNFLNAFKSLSRFDTKYILFGQDPYPREKSAIGYAFIDGNVDKLFSDNGLSKEVNKATSLRNFIKMLLISDGKLDISNTSQEDIQKIDKIKYINTIVDLKNNFEKNGILLLNMALIFTTKDDSKKHIKSFRNFIMTILKEIQKENIKLIFFGNSAKNILKDDLLKNFEKIHIIHPYNHSFITNELAINFFREFNLLKK